MPINKSHPIIAHYELAITKALTRIGEAIGKTGDYISPPAINDNPPIEKQASELNHSEKQLTAFYQLLLNFLAKKNACSQQLAEAKAIDAEDCSLLGAQFTDLLMHLKRDKTQHPELWTHISTTAVGAEIFSYFSVKMHIYGLAEPEKVMTVATDADNPLQLALANALNFLVTDNVLQLPWGEKLDSQLATGVSASNKQQFISDFKRLCNHQPSSTHLPVILREYFSIHLTLAVWQKIKLASDCFATRTHCFSYYFHQKFGPIDDSNIDCASHLFKMLHWLLKKADKAKRLLAIPQQAIPQSLNVQLCNNTNPFHVEPLLLLPCFEAYAKVSKATLPKATYLALQQSFSHLQQQISPKKPFPLATISSELFYRIGAKLVKINNAKPSSTQQDINHCALLCALVTQGDIAFIPLVSDKLAGIDYQFVALLSRTVLKIQKAASQKKPDTVATALKFIEKLAKAPRAWPQALKGKQGTFVAALSDAMEKLSLRYLIATSDTLETKRIAEHFKWLVGVITYLNSSDNTAAVRPIITSNSGGEALPHSIAPSSPLSREQTATTLTGLQGTLQLTHRSLSASIYAPTASSPKLPMVRFTPPKAIDSEQQVVANFIVHLQNLLYKTSQLNNARTLPSINAKKNISRHILIFFQQLNDAYDHENQLLDYLSTDHTARWLVTLVYYMTRLHPLMNVSKDSINAFGKIFFKTIKPNVALRDALLFLDKKSLPDNPFSVFKQGLVPQDRPANEAMQASHVILAFAQLTTRLSASQTELPTFIFDALLLELSVHAINYVRGTLTDSALLQTTLARLFQLIFAGIKTDDSEAVLTGFSQLLTKFDFNMTIYRLYPDGNHHLAPLKRQLHALHLAYFSQCKKQGKTLPPARYHALANSAEQLALHVIDNDGTDFDFFSEPDFWRAIATVYIASPCYDTVLIARLQKIAEIVVFGLLDSGCLLEAYQLSGEILDTLAITGKHQDEAAYQLVTDVIKPLLSADGKNVMLPHDLTFELVCRKPLGDEIRRSYQTFFSNVLLQSMAIHLADNNRASLTNLVTRCQRMPEVMSAVVAIGDIVLHLLKAPQSSSAFAASEKKGALLPVLGMSLDWPALKKDLTHTTDNTAHLILRTEISQRLMTMANSLLAAPLTMAQHSALYQFVMQFTPLLQLLDAKQSMLDDLDKAVDGKRLREAQLEALLHTPPKEEKPAKKKKKKKKSKKKKPEDKPSAAELSRMAALAAKEQSRAAQSERDKLAHREKKAAEAKAKAQAKAQAEAKAKAKAKAKATARAKEQATTLAAAAIKTDGATCAKEKTATQSIKTQSAADENETPSEAAVIATPVSEEKTPGPVAKRAPAPFFSAPRQGFIATDVMPPVLFWLNEQLKRRFPGCELIITGGAIGAWYLSSKKSPSFAINDIDCIFYGLDNPYALCDWLNQLNVERAINAKVVGRRQIVTFTLQNGDSAIPFDIHCQKKEASLELPQFLKRDHGLRDDASSALYLRLSAPYSDQLPIIDCSVFGEGLGCLANQQVEVVDNQRLLFDDPLRLLRLMGSLMKRQATPGPRFSAYLTHFIPVAASVWHDYIYPEQGLHACAHLNATDLRKQTLTRFNNLTKGQRLGGLHHRLKRLIERHGLNDSLALLTHYQVLQTLFAISPQETHLLSQLLASSQRPTANENTLYAAIGLIISQRTGTQLAKYPLYPLLSYNSKDALASERRVNLECIEALTKGLAKPRNELIDCLFSAYQSLQSPEAQPLRP